MLQLDYKESWALKYWYFWIMVLEKTLESPLDYEEIKPVNPKGDQSWTLIGRTDAEDETPILWPPDMKNQLIGKYPDVGKDWRQEEEETTEDEMVGWHHWLDGREFEQASGVVGDGPGSVTCCSPQGCKESDTTVWLNWTPRNSNSCQQTTRIRREAQSRALRKNQVATGLEKVSFHSNPKERQCQRMLKLSHNCTHLTR